jgi:hypothetical protein
MRMSATYGQVEVGLSRPKPPSLGHRIACSKGATEVTFRPSAPNKKRRWLALLAIVMLGTGVIG